MELRSLEYFVAVAEELSFTRAAQRCYVSQPSISQQIQGLEQELGEPLFERTPRGVVLASGGQALLPYARACLAAAAAARAEFAARSGALHGELLLGTVDGIEDTGVPRLLGILHRRYPQLAVQLSHGTSAPLLAKVNQGRLDAAIVAEPIEGLPSGVQSRPLLSSQIVAVLSATSSLSAGGPLELETICDQPIITYDRESGLRPLIDHAFARLGVQLVVAYATNDVALQVALAHEGVGVALAAGSDPALHRARPIPLNPPIVHRKVLIWPRTAPAPPLQAFLDLWTETIDATGAGAGP